MIKFLKSLLAPVLSEPPPPALREITATMQEPNTALDLSGLSYTLEGEADSQVLRVVGNFSLTGAAYFTDTATPLGSEPGRLCLMPTGEIELNPLTAHAMLAWWESTGPVNALTHKGA